MKNPEVDQKHPVLDTAGAEFHREAMKRMQWVLQRVIEDGKREGVDAAENEAIGAMLSVAVSEMLTRGTCADGIHALVNDLVRQFAAWGKA